MNLWKDIAPGPSVPEVVYAVIEIPRGSRNKYEYEKELESFALDRVLYSPFTYPAEYGFIPQTIYYDGDPMDIMVLMDQITFPGCIIESKIIGMMKMIDGGDKDDKLLAVPINDPRYKDVNDIDDVPEHLLKEIAHFFSEYKTLEGKKTEILGWENKESALKATKIAIELYNENEKE